MHAIRAIWTNGQIKPAEPVDWPEGSELLVEPVVKSDKVGVRESDWLDDDASIAAWVAAVEKIEPMVWANREREAYERYQQEARKANIEAVRKQMNAMPDSTR